MAFTYVYILQSEAEPECFYTGHTDDVRARLIKHNAGEVIHTAKHKPWHIKNASPFQIMTKLCVLRSI